MDRSTIGRMISRRQLLKSAVLGVAAVQFAPPPGAVQSQPDDSEIYSGTLIAQGDGWLEIEETGGLLRRIPIGGDTAFWKGGDSSPQALAHGDDLMIKVLVASGRALYVWSNLTRIRGNVVRAQKDGYLVQTYQYHKPSAELFLTVDNRSSFRMGMAASGSSAPTRLSAGDAVDAIGERMADRIYGTLVYVYPQNSAPPPGTPQPEPTIVVGPLCTYISYGGTATWEDCATGAGACGTCNTSNSNQAAWPAMSTCGCCTSSCCDCSANCKNQLYLSCGSIVVVGDLCQTKSRTVTIVDCGPCQESNCSGCSPQLCGSVCGSPDCKNNATPVIHLTKPTFAYFYNPANRGCFSCNAKVCQ